MFTGPVLCYTWRCGQCGNTHDWRVALFRGDEIPKPSLPDGWTDVLGSPVCGDHEIMIRATVDGKEYA